MNSFEVSCLLSDLLKNSRSVYMKTEPEVPDFTTTSGFKLVVFGGKQKLEIEVDPSSIVNVIALLDVTVFDKEQVDRLYVWNIKSLASYFKHYSKKYFTPTASIIDLKVIENFLGVRKNAPENLIEAVNRTKLALNHKGWQTLYKPVHLPLLLRVLPSLETTPLLNEETKRCEYPFYEPEGQINGRMNCLKKFTQSYLPHNMGPDVKKVLKPRGYGMRFLYSDFRHCEVTVLQWLSGDPKLGEILEAGGDLHSRVYEVITGDQCNTDTKRNLSKKMFLPVMYGCGASGLARNLGLADTVAAELISRIRSQFSVASNWMHTRQEAAKQGPILDFFGRPRLFNPKEAYLARNFSVQGVAATACQEKLIQLQAAHDGQDSYLVFSVHDGFGMVVKPSHARKTYKSVKQICEAPSKLCPGLAMKVEIKFGARLDNLKVLWKD